MAQLLRIAIILLSVMCASCTLIYSHPPPDAPFGHRISGGIGYHVHVHGRGFPPKVSERDTRFVRAVEKALKDSGYHHPVPLPGREVIARDFPKVKLMVDIEVLSIYYDYGHASALQEWLTGLSLGIIPSWATRHELKIQFELLDGDVAIRKWEYFPETLWINHLLFFPIAIFQMSLASEFERQAEQLEAATKQFLGIELGL